MGDNKVSKINVNGREIDRAWVIEHAQPIRLVGAAVCQVLAFLLIIDSSGVIYGSHETFIVILMLAATGLAAYALFRYLVPLDAKVKADANVTDLPKTGT
jgi:hypothetical protein